MHYDFFVAHGFTQEKLDDLRAAIRSAFRGSKLRAYYADEEVVHDHILDKVVERILSTDFGIYDVTDYRPNVFLELGIAIGAKRPYYIIVSHGTEMPSDLAGLDRIEYRSNRHLTEQLRQLVVSEQVGRLKRRRSASSDRHPLDDVPESVVRSKVSQLYQAEELSHRFGNEVADIDATNGRAWCGDLSHFSGHLTFGPYETLPRVGKYVAFFRMKVESNESAEAALLLDAVGVEGGGVASRAVPVSGFAVPGQYQLLALNFECRRLEKMEYRVFNQKPWPAQGRIWVDYVAVVEASALPAAGS